MEHIDFEAQLCCEIATLKQTSKKQKSKHIRLADIEYSLQSIWWILNIEDFPDLTHHFFNGPVLE